MNEGKLVPDELMIALVMEEATPNLEEGKSLLLDGFPRTVGQANHLEQVVHVDLVINLDIPTETIVERIADRYVYHWNKNFGRGSMLLKIFLLCCCCNRWIHPASGRIYSYSYNPPKVDGLDDETGEPLVQRPDDQPEKVRARLAQYNQVRNWRISWCYLCCGS